ncbi:MAG: hypothetical protein FWF50_07130 [Defluviitaleaceae bacterium]|nr:hypothetical protein [Defluviitaleaceae bacterium]
MNNDYNHIVDILLPVLREQKHSYSEEYKNQEHFIVGRLLYNYLQGWNVDSYYRTVNVVDFLGLTDEQIKKLKEWGETNKGLVFEASLFSHGLPAFSESFSKAYSEKSGLEPSDELIKEVILEYKLEKARELIAKKVSPKDIVAIVGLSYLDLDWLDKYKTGSTL